MTTRFLAADISWDEAPGGQPVLKAYPDPLSKGPPWTIGFGSTGPDITEGLNITPAWAVSRRDADIATIIQKCSDNFVWWANLSPERQDVLVNMGYQMGFAGLLKFVGTLGNIAKGAWGAAAVGMRASLWATKQTPTRALRLAKQMETGVRAPRTYDSTVPIPPVVPMSIQPAAPVPQAKEPTVSIFSKYVFDPLKAAIAKALMSSSPTTQATASAAAGAVAGTPEPTVPDPTHNSPAGVADPLIAALETALKDAVDAFVTEAVSELPLVGGLLAPEAVKLANMGLTFAEQHAITYISGLFHFGKTSVGAVSNA
jgi:GH24 family phage-related lysozyme (muramidase)